jgi:WhiB family redox-sensing transcriptional regulator
MPRPLCKDFDPETWFPLSPNSPDNERAKAVCALCPLQDPCLRWALRNGIQFGIWGGLDEDERRTINPMGEPSESHPLRDRTLARQQSQTASV